MRMLEDEGFGFGNYIDIFDGGPAMTVVTDQIATIREAREAEVTAIGSDGSGEQHIVAAGRLSGFRACLGRVTAVGGRIALDSQSAEALQVATGDPVIHVRA